MFVGKARSLPQRTTPDKLSLDLECGIWNLGSRV
jgi:hypothetical protein